MKAISLSVALALSVHCFGQQLNFHHAISVEVADVAIYAGWSTAARYDYLFNHTTRGFWDAGISAGRLSGTWSGYVGQAGLTYNLGRRTHFFEVGITTTFVDYTDEFSLNREFSVGPTAGYRLILPLGLQLRAFVSLLAGKDISMGAGAGLGWAFGRRR